MLRNTKIGLALLALATSLVLATEPQGSATAQPLAKAHILRVATLANGGASLTVRTRIRCQPNGDVWEAYLTATQGNIKSFTSIPVTCDGRPHVTPATFSADPTGTFKRGHATVHVSVVDEDNNLTEFASDTRRVKVLSHCFAGSGQGS